MSDDEPTVETLVDALQSTAGDRLQAVYRFGSEIARGKGKGQPRVLVLVDQIDRALLDEIGPIVSQGQRDGIRVRVDTPDNLVRGADAFPAFTLELIRHRTLIAGEDVLIDLEVNTGDLRLHVEHGLRGMFRDLVSGYIDGKVHGGSLLDVRRATRRLIFLFEGALRAAGTDIGEDPDTAKIIELFRAKLEGDTEPPWNTFDRFVTGDLGLDTAGMRELYGALFVILHRAIAYVDRLA